MLESKAAYYKILAEKIIEKLILRNMEGYYAATKEEALELVKEKFLTQGVSAAWGGSMTMTETGLMDYLQSGESGCIVYDRMTASEYRECGLFYYEYQCHHHGRGTGQYRRHR